MSPIASRFGRVLLAAVVCVSALPAADAIAQPVSAADEARGLAREGKKALDAENYKEALDKVTRAEALYHAPTHLLLMGNAQAGLGRLADALATFEKLTAEPMPDAAPKAFKDALETGRKRVKELISRVPSVLIAVESAEAATPVVQIDGVTMNFSAGVAMRFNPGDHVVTVTAEGFDPVEQKITLPEKGGVVRVPILLQKKGAPAGSATASAPATAGSTTASASASETAAPTAPSASASTPSPSRAPAYVAFGVAGAAIAVGAVLGGVSLSMAGELKTVCKDNLCPESERGKLGSANALAHGSTATFVIGGLAAAAGFVLLAVDIGPSQPKARTGSSATIEPWISVGGGGVRGRF
jgi:hypothetical protein